MRPQAQSRRSILLIAFFSAAFVLLLIAVFQGQHPKNPLSKAEQSFGLEDKDIFVYLEAISKIKENASFLSPDTTREQIVAESLKFYLWRTDPSSDYMTREEYRKFKESQDDRYVGIGMEIKKDPVGRIICVPYPGGPAAEAGITFGDQLKKIDGVPVDGKSILAVASMARGKRGTSVNFVIATKTGTEKNITVTRSDLTSASVSRRWVGHKPLVKISFFTRDTKAKLEHVLQSWERNNPIIIDLRGNSGGDLHAAIDSAMLFLGQGKRIVSIKTRTGSTSYESKSGGAVNLTSPIYLWQDEATASAAEVFIAALTENERAVSIGSRTSGKGTKQDIIELSDGSAIVFSTGQLQTPRGTSYHGYGLNPTHLLKDAFTDTVHYMAKIEELTAAKRQTSLWRSRGNF